MRINKAVIAVLLFAISVLLLTRMDYLVNAQLYQFGLTFSESWAITYWALYILLYQLFIIVLLLFCKNWKLGLVFEVFTLTSSQDLVYFGVWSGGVFPKGNWTWMFLYKVFGFWNTQSQILLTATSLTAVLLFFAYKGGFRIVRKLLQKEQTQ
jgi:hypothetical protein